MSLNLNELLPQLYYTAIKTVKQIDPPLFVHCGVEKTWVLGGMQMTKEQECIKELYLLIDDITNRATKKDLSLLRSCGTGGSDMYQGMPPICRKRDDIVNRYGDVIRKVFDD